MPPLTNEQRRAVDAAKDEIRRRLQQMLSSGVHSAGAVKQAMAEVMEDWD